MRRRVSAASRRSPQPRVQPGRNAQTGAPTEEPQKTDSGRRKTAPRSFAHGGGVPEVFLAVAGPQPAPPLFTRAVSAKPPNDDVGLYSNRRTCAALPDRPYRNAGADRPLMYQ